MIQKAAFLDRDGVINKDKGYIYKIEDFEFIKNVFTACRALNHLGYRIIIVTNQSGIGRGYFTEADYQKLNNWMLQQFLEQQIDITAVYHCPYHPQHGIGRYKLDSPYRKPGPQMLLDAAAEYKIDMETSFIAGDKLSDIAAGRAAGLGQYFLLGNAEIPSKDYVIKRYKDLLDLVQNEFTVR